MSDINNPTDNFEDFQKEALEDNNSNTLGIDDKQNHISKKNLLYSNIKDYNNISTNFNVLSGKIGELQADVKYIKSKQYISWTSGYLWSIALGIVAVWGFASWQVPLIPYDNMKDEVKDIKNELKQQSSLQNCKNSTFVECLNNNKCTLRMVIKKQNECENKFN